MKVLMLALSLAFTTTSFAGPLKVAGVYAFKKEIYAAYASADRENCEDEGGRWQENGEDSACLIEVSDRVVLRKTSKNNILKADIVTFGTNAHMCTIDGNATLSKDRLTVTLKQNGEDYNMETDSLDKVTCVVTLRLSNDGKVMNVSSNNKCHSFCGANAWLEAEGLKRVK